MSNPIYLDYNATTPIDPRVAEVMLPYLNEHFGNPSSSHSYGAATKKAVEKARRQVADMIHASMEEIIFTSGGSESNNYAIKGAAFANREKGNHIITSRIEHPAVIEVCKYLETKGFKITYLPVNNEGLVYPEQVEDAITSQTILITIMHANNEVGTIQPIREITEIAHQKGILVHTDCAQSVGKIPVWVNELGVDLLSIAGHKLYAPKGIGALYVRTGVKLEKQIHGADHEMNWRAGTENILEIAGLGKACELIGQDFEKPMNHLKSLRDHLERQLKNAFPSCKVNGHIEKRLPNTSSISFKGLEANTIISELSDKVAASAGAACHSDSVDVSAVLEAMQVPVEYAMGTIRFSVGRFSTKDEIDQALGEIEKVVHALQPKEAPIFLDIGKTDFHLTQYTHGLGCACKLRPQLLEEVLRKMPVPSDPNILIGTDSADDAAVYKINESTAIVQTVDFFTPIVDDPYQFGVIAAVNSLSDIYAMGGKPLFALNIVGFPSNRLPMSVLESILQGAQSVADKAGISIIGGHTVDDTEPKFGMAVTGVVHPDKIVSNKGAKSGDVLILTKPLGTGILSTALKQKLLDEKQISELTRTMSWLNREAAEAMQEIGVNACTDVTGFGLLGHLMEMMQGSGTSAEIVFDKLPFLDGVIDLAVSGVVPGGTRDNFEFTRAHTQYPEQLSEVRRLVINDAQTSGGLLISVPSERSEVLVELLHTKGVEKTVVIGKVVNKMDYRIIVAMDE
jgi:cysteine desulfurase